MDGEIRVKYINQKCKASVKLSKAEAKNLKKAIERSGLKQEQLVKVYGVSATVFSNWINGHRSMDLGTLCELYDVCSEPDELKFVREYIAQCKKGGFELDLKRNSSLVENPQIIYARMIGRLRIAYDNVDLERQKQIINSIEGLLE